ncbi:NRDE-2, necessary for RNA interference-domain-containing protein [Phlebopus sp. FC_14]|nr:NRDE-2, necessary for RNA interference-domain-containing protein [Phlebopus sp. FC_14]
MPAPSFSSFPPSFSSFPDLDPGFSRRTASPPVRSDTTSERQHESRQKSKLHKAEARSHKRNKAKKAKREAGVLQVDDLSHRKDVCTAGSVVHDERLNSEDDRRRLEQVSSDDDEWISRPLFYADRKGDPLNVTYGSLHAGDVPKYHPVSHGRHILGLGEAWVVFRRAGKGVELTIGRQPKQPVLTDSRSKALLSRPARRFNVSRGNYKYEDVDGFLRLPSRAGRQTGADYRSITYTQTELDSDSSSSASEEEEESENENEGSALTSHQLALKTLEETLVNEPSSVRAWLSLLALSVSVVTLTSKNAAKVRSEIALSILERARAHPCNLASHILWLKYLRAGEEVWHDSRLRTEWEAALKLGGVEIWMEWLEWRIRKPAQGIDGVVADATRALKALGDSEDREVDKLRVVWRAAVALREAGFYERAVAVFQAQAELTFEVPQSLYGLPVETQLESLEEFWDSEVPRVGESNAKGWSAWVSSGRPEASLCGGETPMDVASASTDPFIRWHEDETLADQTPCIPARSTDKSSVSDPYATVLFADIKDLLLPLTTQRAKNVFRLIWLSVLGLHIPGFVESLTNSFWDDRWSYTHLVTPSRLSSLFPNKGETRSLLPDSYAGALIGRQKEYSSAFGPVKDWRWDVFGPMEWIGKEQWRMWTANDVQGVGEDFIRAVFNQLRCGTDDHEWDTYAVAFEAAINVNSALKLSRSFLSTDRDSLPHWAIHARLERLRGRVQDARKVYQTVLIGARRPPTQTFVGRLWWDWAEMEWLAGDQDVALRLVMRSGNVDGSGGMMILRAKRNLEDIINAPHVQWKDREAWVKLRALIELLASLSPPAVLAIFDNQSRRGESAREYESLMVASLVMLYNHSIVIHAPTSPSVLRDRLQVAIETYPSNTIIIGMFLEAEKGHGVWGRVREQLGQNAASRCTGAEEKTVARRVAEVWVAGWEKGRWECEVERTRSGLTAAVESERTRNSALTWRVALEFEIRAGQLQRAKNLLYRAVSEFPLAKGLYLLAFGALRPVFMPHELNNFIDAMAERGLRMRRGLDEYVRVAEITEESQPGSDCESSQGGEDEIEHEAKERRRLMPY